MTINTTDVWPIMLVTDGFSINAYPKIQHPSAKKGPKTDAIIKGL